MGIYTIHDDPKIDEYIEGKLKIVVDTIQQNIPEIRSIVLGGGFGKGEGSVAVKAGKIELLRDFDIFIVLKSKKRPRREMEHVRQVIPKRLGLRQDHDYELLEDFHVDIGSYTSGTIEVYCDSQTVDLKYNKVIYGDEIDSLVKWEPTDIPARCGWKILLQQPYRLVQVFSAGYPGAGIPPSMEGVFLREVSKTYIYIGVALSILAGSYQPYDAKRVPLLEKIYPEKFPGLYRELPDLIAKIKLSTDYKLDPSGGLNKAALDYWFEARYDLGRVMEHCFYQAFNIHMDNLIQFSESLEKALTRHFYLPLLAGYLAGKHIPGVPGLPRFLNYLYNIKDNLFYSLSELGRRKLSFPLLKGVASPSIKLLSTLPLILFAIDEEEGKINHLYLDKTLQKISFVRTSGKPASKWDVARQKALELNRLAKITV